MTTIYGLGHQNIV